MREPIVAEWGVIPSIRVRDMAEALAFYRGTLGFTLDSGGDDASNSSLTRGDAHVMIETAADHFGDEYNAAIRERLGTPSCIALYMEAADLAEFHSRLASSRCTDSRPAGSATVGSAGVHRGRSRGELADLLAEDAHRRARPTVGRHRPTVFPDPTQDPESNMRHSRKSPLTDSNRRPPPYHGGALPTELRGRCRASVLGLREPANTRRSRHATPVTRRHEAQMRGFFRQVPSHHKTSAVAVS